MPKSSIAKAAAELGTTEAAKKKVIKAVETAYAEQTVKDKKRKSDPRSFAVTLPINEKNTTVGLRWAAAAATGVKAKDLYRNQAIKFFRDLGFTITHNGKKLEAVTRAKNGDKAPRKQTSKAKARAAGAQAKVMKDQPGLSLTDEALQIDAED